MQTDRMMDTKKGKQGLLHQLYEEAFRRALQLVETNTVPDLVVRKGIQYLLSKRAKEVCNGLTV